MAMFKLVFSLLKINSKFGISSSRIVVRPDNLVVAQFAQDKLLHRAKVVSKFIKLDSTLTEVDMAEFD